MDPNRRVEALKGALWGVALGDALGLPYEGLSAARIAACGLRLDRGLRLGGRALVSDDTEQTALVLESMIGGCGSEERTRQLFRRAMGAWFLRLPFGIGFATLRACLRILLGLSDSGVASAGNGAAMRAGVIGVYLAEDEDLRRRLTATLARVTHTDPRAVEGALFVAELAAGCARDPGRGRAEQVARAMEVVRDHELRGAIEAGLAEAAVGRDRWDQPNTGFVVQTLGLCVWAFVRHGDAPIDGVRAAIAAGGDTDTAAAIVGGWLGALHGAASLPAELLGGLVEGPFGPAHLGALAEARIPQWSRARASLRNLAAMWVVVGHLLVRRVQAPFNVGGRGEPGVWSDGHRRR